MHTDELMRWLVQEELPSRPIPLWYVILESLARTTQPQPHCKHITPMRVLRVRTRHDCSSNLALQVLVLE